MNKPITILMADDDEDDRQFTREALAQNQMANDFREVKDGEALLAYLRREGEYADAPEPGLVLLDLNMPRKDGREALRDIRADPKLRHIPVVVLTTSREEEDVLKSYQLGANSFVSKPVGFDQLIQVLHDLQRYWFQVVERPDAEAKR